MTTLTSTSADGTRIDATVHGTDTDGLPVVCLPGMTRNARDFDALATVLSRPETGPARRVIVVDFRGRGRSGRTPGDTYNLEVEMTDLLTALDGWGIGEAQFVGTSRGGLLTMFLALFEPQRIERVVLNDIGPTIERIGLARIAQTVGAAMHHASYDALASHLVRVQSTQFPRLNGGQWRRYAEQLASPNGEGGVTLDYDPAMADTVRGYSPDDPAPDFWPAFAALGGKPVLVIRGAHSDLLSAATVESMRRRHCGLQTLVIPDEGHAPLLWDRLSTETIKTFLAA